MELIPSVLAVPTVALVVALLMFVTAVVLACAVCFLTSAFSSVVKPALPSTALSFSFNASSTALIALPFSVASPVGTATLVMELIPSVLAVFNVVSS